MHRMKSMTGYGYSEYQDDKIHITIELKSYNNRYLDIIINQPSFLNPLEPDLRKYLSNNADRGRVELYIRVRELEENLVLHLDKSAAASYAETLRELAQVSGLDDKIELSHLLAFDGILKTEKKRDIDNYRTRIMPLLETCFAQWDESRKVEGISTEQDISKSTALIYDALNLFEQKAGEMEVNIKDNIRTKFMDVLGDKIDEQRVLAETAVLLVKYSINEEIVRLKGHLDSFTASMSGGAAVGKKLDFICQEINREVNTIGSKSFMLEVNQKVIEVKDNLENIREQLRNVE